MLFTGKSEHTIDGKFRLAIPSKHRFWGEGQPPAWYCIPITDGPIRLYTEDHFNKLGEQGGDSLTPDESVAEFETTFFSSAERVELDASGRLLVPKWHVQRAGLTTRNPSGGLDVVLVGARTRLEIWDKTRWDATEDERHKRLPGLMQRIEANKKASTNTTTHNH